MGHNDNIDFELNDALQELLDEYVFDEDSKEYKIIQFIIENSVDELNPDEKLIYNSTIATALEQRSNEIRRNEILNSNPD